MTIKERFQKLFKKKKPLLYKVPLSFDPIEFEDDLTEAVIEKSAEIADLESDLMLQFEKESGKHAVWGGKKTKGFLKWKEDHNS